jgi:hypothetical protein
MRHPRFKSTAELTDFSASEQVKYMAGTLQDYHDFIYDLLCHL